MRKWLIERFLPAWAKETLLSECRQLRRENRKLRAELRELEAYTRGIHLGLRSVRRARQQGGQA